MQQYKLVAEHNQLKAIHRNTAHYLNIARTFEPGDLVFAFSENREDQVPHRKLRIKWSGPYVFIRKINSQIAEIGTLPSEKTRIILSSDLEKAGKDQQLLRQTPWSLELSNMSDPQVTPLTKKSVEKCRH